MKYVKLFEDFVSSYQENDADFNLQLEQFINEYIELEDEYALNEVAGKWKNILGWVFFPLYSLINVAYQYTKKKKMIQAQIAQVDDPKKKEKLKAKLEAITYEEMKAKDKIKAKQKELRAKAAEAKKDMTPDERKKYNKEKEKMQAKLDKQKEKLSKLQSQDFSGGFV
jgi:hypothetical protein